MVEVHTLPLVIAHLGYLVGPIPSLEIGIVCLLEVDFGDNHRTDSQSERQAQYLHEVVLSPAREILECVNYMIHL